MPAFNYTFKERMPGAGGHLRPQARGISAPVIRAPKQQTVLMGSPQRQRFIPEQRNEAAYNITGNMRHLGDMFLRQSLLQANEQTALEASDAIANYRRATSEAFYNEKDGLFSKTGAEGSRIYQDNEENINALRDKFAEGLSESAKKKYLLKVAGYHNQNLDQLAKKQFNNVAQYREEIRIKAEGEDAADIFSFIKNDFNISAILSTLNDTPQYLSEVEDQKRKDRLVVSAVTSADAQGVSAEVMKILVDNIKPVASQKVQNALLEELDVYKEAERVAIKRSEADAKEARKLKQDENFNSLLGMAIEREHLDPRIVTQVDLAKGDKKTILGMIEKNATNSSRPTLDKHSVMASLGLLNIDELKSDVQAGDIVVKDYLTLVEDNKDEIKRQSFPEKQSGDVRDAYKLLDSYKKEEGLHAVEAARWKRDLKNYIEDNPGKDPSIWLEQRIQPIKQGNVARFVNGVMGKKDSSVRANGMKKYQHFTPLQQEVLEKLREEFEDQGKGNLDLLSEEEVEMYVNMQIKSNEYAQ